MMPGTNDDKAWIDRELQETLAKSNRRKEFKAESEKVYALAKKLWGEDNWFLSLLISSCSACGFKNLTVQCVPSNGEDDEGMSQLVGVVATSLDVDHAYERLEDENEEG
jgi:hypothetical protein